MNAETKLGMNAAERERSRTLLSKNRTALRRARRVADDDAQREELQARLDKNELERARINQMALEDRDDDAGVVALIGTIENAVNELSDEVDAFAAATEKARRFAKVIAVADRALASVVRLAALVF